MIDLEFNVDAWLNRIGHHGARDPTLATLRAIVTAQSGTIPFENVDVLLGRTPRLDLVSLQHKTIVGGRGGYCFELNSLLYAGLIALGFQVTPLLARVIRGLEADAAGSETHMTLLVDLPEGPFLADVGFGNLTPTAPLALRPNIEQQTPHEVMRLWPVGDELTLQAKLGPNWQNIYRFAPRARLPIDYEVANWFTATHPASPFVSNMIVARPGPAGVRKTLFNGRVSIRTPGEPTERFRLDDDGIFQSTLVDKFGLILSDADVSASLSALDRKGTRSAEHPFFT
jgi:N-hydroxyarylamine O-acetyltransferase